MLQFPYLEELLLGSAPPTLPPGAVSRYRPLVPVRLIVRRGLAVRFSGPMEVPDDVPVLVGQIPLEMLDLVVDLQGRRLIGNPEHNGEHILELF